MAFWRKKEQKAPLVSEDGRFIDLSSLSGEALAVIKAVTGKIVADNLSPQAIDEISKIHASIGVPDDLQLLAKAGNAYGSPVEQIKFFRQNGKRK